MKYLIDNNLLSARIIGEAKIRDDIYVLDDVLDEWAFNDDDYKQMTHSGVHIVNMETRHLRRMSELMKCEDIGGNLNLVRLYTSEGAADIALLTYVLTERDNPKTLFGNDYTIVTDDEALKKAAQKLSIHCISALPD